MLILFRYIIYQHSELVSLNIYRSCREFVANGTDNGVHIKGMYIAYTLPIQ